MAWMKGRVCAMGDAGIPVTDWGLTHSDITYDVVPVCDGAFFRLEHYLTRFEASRKALRLDVGMDRKAITSALHEMVAASGLREAYVSMVASRGGPKIAGTRDPRHCNNHFFAWCVPYVNIIPRDSAAKLWVAKTVRRISPDSVDPLVKNYHWGDMTTGLLEAKNQPGDFDSALLLDHLGNVTEGPGFNLFAIIRGGSGLEIVTAEAGVLHGISRRTALDVAAELDVRMTARLLPLEELLGDTCVEAFMTSSAGGIMPVAQINGKVFSSNADGSLTRRIRDGYWDMMKRPECRLEIEYSS